MAQLFEPVGGPCFANHIPEILAFSGREVLNLSIREKGRANHHFRPKKSYILRFA